MVMETQVQRGTTTWSLSLDLFKRADTSMVLCRLRPYQIQAQTSPNRVSREIEKLGTHKRLFPCVGGAGRRMQALTDAMQATKRPGQ